MTSKRIRTSGEAKDEEPAVSLTDANAVVVNAMATAGVSSFFLRPTYAVVQTILVEVFSFLQINEAVKTRTISKKMVLPPNLVPQLPRIHISGDELNNWFGGGQDTAPIQAAMSYWTQTTRVLKLDSGRPGLDEMLQLVDMPKVHTLEVWGNMIMRGGRWSLILRQLPALRTLNLNSLRNDMPADEWNQPEAKRPWKSVVLGSMYAGFKSWMMFANPSLTELYVSGDEERQLTVEMVETLVTKAPALETLAIRRCPLQDPDVIYLLLAKGLPKLRDLVLGGQTPVLRQESTVVTLYKAWSRLHRFPSIDFHAPDDMSIEALSQMPTNQLTEISTYEWHAGTYMTIPKWLALVATSNRWTRIHIEGRETWEVKTIAGLLRDLPDLVELRIEAPFQFSVEIVRAISERKKPCPKVSLGCIYPSCSPRQEDTTTTTQDLQALIASGNVSELVFEEVVLKRIAGDDFKELNAALEKTKRHFRAAFLVHVDQIDFKRRWDSRLEHVILPTSPPDDWRPWTHARISLYSNAPATPTPTA